MNDIRTINVANFSVDGKLDGQESFQLDSDQNQWFEHFIDKFQRLPGDLDLPLEEPLPGIESAVLRICSESTAAYIIYYILETPLIASLLMAGQDEEAEFEIMTTLKFLMLHGDHDDEPDDGDIDAVLAATEFDFESVDVRPTSLQVDLNDDAQFDQYRQRFKRMDQAVALAFFEVANQKIQ